MDTKGVDIIDSLIVVLCYGRVSSESQELERQLKKFRKLVKSERDIFTDKMTGSTLDRPGFQKMLHEAKILNERGYTVKLVFDDISRFARTSKEGQELYFKLIQDGYILEFLSTSHINSEAVLKRMKAIQDIDLTSFKSGKMAEGIRLLIEGMVEMTVATEFERVEKEREDIVRRIKEGMARDDVKAKLGKRVNYPVNLVKIFDQFHEGKISRSAVARELEFESKGKNTKKKGMTRQGLYKSWDKYQIEYERIKEELIK